MSERQDQLRRDDFKSQLVRLDEKAGTILDHPGTHGRKVDGLFGGVLRCRDIRRKEVESD